jgi:hypothetical protein
LEKILGNSESEEVVLICLKVFDKGASLNWCIFLDVALHLLI